MNNFVRDDFYEHMFSFPLDESPREWNYWLIRSLQEVVKQFFKTCMPFHTSAAMCEHLRFSTALWVLVHSPCQWVWKAVSSTFAFPSLLTMLSTFPHALHPVEYLSLRTCAFLNWATSGSVHICMYQFVLMCIHILHRYVFWVILSNMWIMNFSPNLWFMLSFICFQFWLEKCRDRREILHLSTSSLDKRP